MLRAGARRSKRRVLAWWLIQVIEIVAARGGRQARPVDLLQPGAAQLAIAHRHGPSPQPAGLCGQAAGAPAAEQLEYGPRDRRAARQGAGLAAHVVIAAARQLRGLQWYGAIARVADLVVELITDQAQVGHG